MVPEAPVRALGELVSILDSKRVPLSDREREARPGPYPYYGATGVFDHVDDYLFDGQMLLVAEDGSVESDAGAPVLQFVRGKCWVNNHAHVLMCARDIDTRFLYYALSRVAIRPYLTGSVQMKLTQKNLRQIEVVWPDAPTRAAIASVLGVLDDKIELNRRLCERLSSLRQLSYRARFELFEGVKREELTDSELGLIPSGWDVQPIGDMVRVVGGSTPSTKESAFWEDGEHCWATPKDLSRLEFPVLQDTD
jgi:type I restriction enzyme S subunit